MDNLWVDSAIGAIKALAFMCDIITYPVYMLLQRPWERKRRSARLKADPTFLDRKTLSIRSKQVPQRSHLTLVRNNLDTMEKVFSYVGNRYADRPCLGTRVILAEEDEIQPNGRVFKKYVMGEYKWRTFKEAELQAKNFGKGLRSVGHKPEQNVAIFAETRAEWLIAAHGCFKQNMPVVTIYATLGEEAIIHALNETEVKMVITTHDLLPKFRAILDKTPLVETVIFMEDQLKPTDTSGFKSGVEILPFKQVLDVGSKSDYECNPPTAKDTAIIMYTSGSTGLPKGVILSHANMISVLKAFSDAVDIDTESDVFLGYLPLAHVFELLAESVCMMSGVMIGYSTPLTMIDTSSKIKRGTKGDASVLQPTALTAVPLILDRIYKGINDKVSQGGAFKKALFNFAFEYKRKWTRRGFNTHLVDRLVFKQVRRLLGGRVRLILSGGAPLSPDTHELIKICICEKVIQGYGLTETCACGTVMDGFDMSLGRAGAPTTVCDLRLTDWDEGNYRVSDKPFPRGEILIGGENVSPGYYKNPGKTQEDFFETDGMKWFRTGDIGECHADGVIKIIDRKKDLVKLQAGEYVSLGKVETELKTSPLVDNICVYGESIKDHVVALVVPNPVHLQALAVKLGIHNKTLEELCEDTTVEKAVLKELIAHGQKSKLEKFEIPTAIKMVPEAWTPDMGLVTAAFKLKRKDIQLKYQKELNRLYAS
ncbi:unnamed protein product [Bemisia tabaci]|uniref:long-chain-fatty-acid--CoA ligase n=1 Tax=Bemisia tabaci TaxID=7038 RepID=A0A9P0AIR4_BEMTA|nr:unnamed protein product [Bemisia tabaci]